jgi:2-polyprenyl-6-hydroxyphenyl methylase / 3-demethylubiquinone-9 3-methyltransferase
MDDVLNSASGAATARRRRNDPGQYDDLAEHWWDPRGHFAMLHWLARSRGALIPHAAPAGGLLVDLGCGAGLLAPHVAAKGYRHVGVDLTVSALVQAAAHGVHPIRADVTAVPLAGGCADVVAAGEILEHVTDLPAVLAEACRLLRPGGLLVIDTIAATALARFVAVRLAERVPGGPPPGIHDPALLVDRAVLLRECARHGVNLQLRGIRPSLVDVACWLAGRIDSVRMRPVPSTAVLFQGTGRRVCPAPGG